MGAAPLLTILKNGLELKTQPLEGEVVLGRAEGCVIRLDDRAISRQHAVFRAVEGGVQVEKKSEVAPLSVNGTECTKAIVKEGDVISIGPYLVKVSFSDAAPAPETGRTALELVPPVSESAPLEGAQIEPPALPEFSLESSAPADSAPIEMGEISLDEDAQTKLSPAAKVSAKLIFPDGMANVTELELNGEEISLGRGKDCDVVLEDKKASRKHAIIRRAGLNFTIKDLASANGTYVNDSKIEEQELSGDDILRIGNVEFRFLVLSADYAEKQHQFLAVPEPTPAPIPDPIEQPLMESFAPSATQAQRFAAIPGISPPSLAGASQIAGLSAGKSSLFERYRALPPRRKAIWTVVIIGGLFFLLFDEPEKAPAPKKGNSAVVSKDGKAAKDAKPAGATFESLPPEQKKFVESQHALAFDYYKSRDYDKSLFEIQKIFALIPDYKDSREIERYAKEGKRKLEALEEEKRKKEEEEKLKLKIAELVDQAKTLMDQEKHDAVRELFPQILALDPDNQQVSEWRRTLDQLDEQNRIAAQQKAVQEQINLRAWDLYKEGLSLKKRDKYREAIESFKKTFDVGASDKKVERLAKLRMNETRELIAQLRDPVLTEAKQAEDAQDFPKAFNLYKKATEIDPSHPTGYAGMQRIRGILHDRAKALYIDAVLAESYSDFENAKKKFQECKDVAPKDDLYFERAERKLATFIKPKEEQQPQ